MSAPRPPALPADIDRACDEAWAMARQVEGGLTEREARFLGLVAALPRAEGTVVEIGSFKGRSTIMLGLMARRYGHPPVVAVDPHTGPSITDPPLGAEGSSYDAFVANLRRAGVEAHVEIHRAFSRDLAMTWRRPIRLLWIDGDHTYAGAREDWELFRRHLAPGAIVAMHDVLHSYEGPVRVFVEEILRSGEFGAAGVVGSIGWAQYGPGAAAHHRSSADKLAQRLAALIPFARRTGPLGRVARLRYKLRRWRVPHGPVEPESWVREVTTS